MSSVLVHFKIHCLNHPNLRLYVDAECPFAKICQSKFYHFPNVTSMYLCQQKATKWATLSHQSTYLPIKMLYVIDKDLGGMFYQK